MSYRAFRFGHPSTALAGASTSPPPTATRPIPSSIPEATDDELSEEDTSSSEVGAPSQAPVGREWTPRSDSIKVQMQTWTETKRPWDHTGTIKALESGSVLGSGKVQFQSIPTWTVDLGPDDTLMLKDGRKASTVVLRKPPATSEAPMSVTFYVPIEDGSCERLDRDVIWTCEEFKPSEHVFGQVEQSTGHIVEPSDDAASNEEEQENENMIGVVASIKDAASGDKALFEDQDFSFNANISNCQTELLEWNDAELSMEVKDITLEWDDDSDDDLAPPPPPLPVVLTVETQLQDGPNAVVVRDSPDSTDTANSRTEEGRMKIDYWCRAKRSEPVAA